MYDERIKIEHLTRNQTPAGPDFFLDMSRSFFSHHTLYNICIQSMKKIHST